MFPFLHTLKTPKIFWLLITTLEIKSWKFRTIVEIRIWFWNMYTSVHGILQTYIYFIINMWWCPRDLYIRHNDIFRLPCLFFPATSAPKVNTQSIYTTELSFPWRIYTSCGNSGYHPIGAYFVPLVITLGLKGLDREK